MELFHAHNQWATRPADENFDSLEDMYLATRAYADRADTVDVPWNDLRVQATGDDLVLVGKAGVAANLTHYAFGQMASRVKAPAGYLRSLAPTLAAQNLNYGLANADEDHTASLLFHANGGLLLRAATSTRYERIWNHEVIAALHNFCEQFGLRPAHATFNWSGADMPDESELQKSLYASDHDMFAFVMSDQTTVTDPTGNVLRRGVIAINSEVGDKSLKFMGFLFRDVCCNHIIWGAQDLATVSIRHVGQARKKMQEAMVEVRKYMNTAESFDKARFEKTTVKIADTKEDVINTLFSIRSLRLSRVLLEESYDAVKPDLDGDPKTVWGMVQGITRRSQDATYTEDRHDLDVGAGRLLDLVF